MLSFTSLVSLDIIAVKYFFAPEEAGQFAAAAALGKVILFAPAALSLVLLPKVAHNHALGKRTANGLRLAVVALVLFSLPTVTIYLLVPELPVKLLFGASYSESSQYVGLYGVAMIAYALLNLKLWYYAAVSDQRFPFILLLGGVLQAGGYALFHESIGQILLVLVTVPAMLLVMGELVSGGLRGATLITTQPTTD